MISPEVYAITKARLELERKFDLKYEYNRLRNTLPIEKQLTISFDGLRPTQQVLNEWANAAKNIAIWADRLNPDVIILSGRSADVTRRSLIAIDEIDFRPPIVTFDEEENKILYKAECSSLHTDEDFYVDYLLKGEQYRTSLL